MLCSRFHVCTTLSLLVFVSSQIANATKFDVDVEHLFKPRDASEEHQHPPSIPLSTALNQVFGISSQGNFTASLTTSLNVTTSSTPARLTLCQVSDAFVRGPDYHRRQNRVAADALAESIATNTCQSSITAPPPESDSTGSDAGVAWCISRTLQPGDATYSFSVSKDKLHPNHMYMICVTLCLTDISETLNLTLRGRAEFQNPDLFFPQLGFEEALFPIFSAAIIALLALPFLLITATLPVAWCRRIPIRPPVLRMYMSAILVKLLGATLTFVHFFTTAETGVRRDWYLYVRLLLASSADVLFVVAVISISTGYAVMPKSWFVEERSPIFLVYIGVVLQLLIVIAVKIMYPFKYLGAVTYIVAGSSLALIASNSSYRIFRFLRRYGLLIERSHIFLESTPIRQLRILYGINFWIVVTAYVAKIAFVLLYDYRLNRPDLLWGTMEMTDAVLLTWFAVWVFPRTKSALYVDMSNLSNDRFHQAERWRARHHRRQTSNDTSESVSSREVTQNGLAERNEVSSTLATSETGISAQSRAHHRTSSQGAIRLVLTTGRRGSAQDRRNRLSVQQNTAAEGFDFAEESFRHELHPQPPWIAWTSGAALPLPNSFTWHGRRTSASVANREENIAPFLRTPIVVGSPKGSSDVVSLTTGVPITGPNAILKAFDEKGAEITEPSLHESSEGHSRTVANGRDHRHRSTATRLDLRFALLLPLRRQNRANQRQGVLTWLRELQTQNRDASETERTQNQIVEAEEALESDQISRRLSSSTTGANQDGRVSNFSDG